MKKLKNISIIATLLICTVFASCSKSVEFSEEFFDLSASTGTVTAEIGTHTEIKSGNTDIKTIGYDAAESYSEAFSLSGGVGIGSSAGDFEKALGLSYGGAMWETYIAKDETETIVNYAEYQKDDIDFASYDDRFLTVGYVKNEDGSWSVMPFEDLKSVWELEGKLEDGAEIAVISAGLDSDGVITEIVIDRAHYGDFKSFYAAD